MYYLHEQVRDGQVDDEHVGLKNLAPKLDRRATCSFLFRKELRKSVNIWRQI
jgi:hypothetical protein